MLEGRDCNKVYNNITTVEMISSAVYSKMRSY